MTLALSTSAAHPLYLYVVFAVCVLGALALLISGFLAQRRSSWPRRHLNRPAPMPAQPRAESAYPAEPQPQSQPQRREPAAEPAVEAASVKKAAPRKTAARKTATPAAKKTTAKKTTARKTPAQ